jgi:hypothetical protein
VTVRISDSSPVNNSLDTVHEVDGIEVGVAVGLVRLV